MIQGLTQHDAFAGAMHGPIGPAQRPQRDCALSVAADPRPELKVLFVTGYAENAAVRGDFLDPGMDMLTKPFALDALGAKVRAMIERL
jgi:hypothetical protein